MIYINAQIIFFALQTLIAITIAFHILYQCAIMSEIILNITLHGSNCTRLHTIYSIMIAYDKLHCKNIFIALKKLIAITIVFLKSYNLQ